MSRKLRYLSAALTRTGLDRLLRAARSWSGVLCLTYHRIGEPGDSPFDHGLWSASHDRFDRQVGFLARNFDVIGPDDLAGAVARGRGRYVLITFDDGYRCNYEEAFPVLTRHGVGATFFVTTGLLDRPWLPFWDEIAWMIRTCPLDGLPAGPWSPAPLVFDGPHRERAVRTALRAYKSRPHDQTGAYLDALGAATGRGRYAGRVDDLWMTWDMVRAMRRGGMTIGGHTASHPLMPRLPRERQDAEIAGCAARIEAELGEPMRYFSYPDGKFNDDTRACLAARGVALAFSYYGGMRRFDDWDPLDVRRTFVEHWHTPDQFLAVTSLPQYFA